MLDSPSEQSSSTSPLCSGKEKNRSPPRVETEGAGDHVLLRVRRACSAVIAAGLHQFLHKEWSRVI